MSNRPRALDQALSPCYALPTGKARGTRLSPCSLDLLDLVTRATMRDQALSPLQVITRPRGPW